MLRYGVALVGMSYEEAMDTNVGDFVRQVDAYLLLEDSRMETLADTLIPHFATFTSVMMGASGNMKKSYNPTEMAQALYPKEEIWGIGGTTEKSFEENKGSLIDTFKIDESELV